MQKEPKLRVRIGLLAVQGAFIENRQHLSQLANKYPHLDIEVIDVRSANQFDSTLDGLIVPGGESTTVSKFLLRNGLLQAFEDWFNSYNPSGMAWGICAGLIVLSDTVVDMKNGGQNLFRGLGITTDRNFYGRQSDSFEAKVELQDPSLILDGEANYPGVFIRAPKILSINKPDVKVLAKHTGAPVAVFQQRIMGCSFHPELTEDSRFHEYFLNKVVEAKQSSQNQSTAA